MVDENDAPARTNLADSGSLLGMLQRGRGEGYLRALAAPPETVWPLLFECITNDPRLDGQCEEREEYYASLILARGMDVEPLGAYLRRNDTGILENHATFEDVPLLIEALRQPETLRREDFRLPSGLNAMARLDGIGPVPELERVFCEAQSSFDRHRAAAAMAATAPVHFTAEYAFECLWDCDSDTRALGCEMVNLSMPGALERLRELAADPDELDNVRQEADERLEGF